MCPNFVLKYSPFQKLWKFFLQAWGYKFPNYTPLHLNGWKLSNMIQWLLNTVSSTWMKDSFGLLPCEFRNDEVVCSYISRILQKEWFWELVSLLKLLVKNRASSLLFYFLKGLFQLMIHLWQSKFKNTLDITIRITIRKNPRKTDKRQWKLFVSSSGISQFLLTSSGYWLTFSSSFACKAFLWLFPNCCSETFSKTRYNT